MHRASKHAAAAGVLVRDYVQRALYAPGAGYFARHDVVTAAPPLQFSNMLGSLEFRQRVQEAYAASDQEWLTPSELFAPFWSHALAEYVVQAYLDLVQPSQRLAAAEGLHNMDGESVGLGQDLPPLHVYEVGAGTGTNALHFCSYLQSHHPHLYPHLRYTTVEISAPLAAKQRALLAQAGHGAVHVALEADVAALGGSDLLSNPDPCFVLVQEVLDNLPHDKVVRRGAVPQSALVTAPLQHPPGDGDPLLPLVSTAAALGADQGVQGGDSEQFQEQAWCEARVAVAGDVSGGGQAAFASAMGLGGSGDIPSSLPPLTEVYAPLTDPWARAAFQLGVAHRPAVTQRGPMSHYAGDLGEQHPCPPPASGSALQAAAESLAGWLYPEQHPPSIDACVAKDMRSATAAYVPTGALRMLASLTRALPRHHLIAADFYNLPRSNAVLPRLPEGGGAVAACGPHDGDVAHFLPAVNEPLVTSKPAGSAALVDHATYLSPAKWGSADIYYSSDFPALAGMAQHLRQAALAHPGPAADMPLHSRWRAALDGLVQAAREAGGVEEGALSRQRRAVRSTAQFMGQYGRHVLPRTRTLTGYNPLLHGYENTHFLLVDNAT